MIGIINGTNKLSDAQYESIYAMVDKFNDMDVRKDTESYFVIYSGRKNAKFTLYKWYDMWKNSLIGSREQFVTILSTKFDIAVKKAMELIGNRPFKLFISEESTVTYSHDPMIFQFGKYKGQSVDEVAAKDFSYIQFIAKNVEPKNATIGKTVKYAKELVEQFWNKKAEENKAKTNSEYLGQYNDKLTNIKIVINKIKTYTDAYDPTLKTYKFFGVVEGTENNVTFNSYGFDRFGFKENDVIEISSARISGTYEHVGVKTTTLNYVRVKTLNGEKFKKITE